MKKKEWPVALAAGLGIAAVVYYLLTKRDIPEGATAVSPFDKDRYLGLWHEVARLPSRIEKNLANLTEEYALNADGTLKVVTTAYNTEKDKWTKAEGKIKFAGAEDIGMLKVSYFGPFYAAYNVIGLDADYQYALVTTSNLNYLWILSRETTIPDDVKARFLYTAAKAGFAIEQLEWM